MVRIATSCAALGLAFIALLAWTASAPPQVVAADTPTPAVPAPAKAPAPMDVAQAEPKPAPPLVALPPPVRKGVADPVVVTDCQLTVIDKQDVPSQRDGVILAIYVKENDVVAPGTVLAQLDNQLAIADRDIKVAKSNSARADYEASVKTRDEAKKRYDTSVDLRRRNAISEEELRGALLTWERYIAEAYSKKEAITLADLELKQSEDVLKMYQIKSSVNGVVKTILKHPGEAIKNLETFFQIQSHDILRAEGMVELKYLHQANIHKGMRVLIEPSRDQAIEQARTGHLQEITSLAVSKDATNPLVVSASRDRTVRVWDRVQRQERAVFQHPAPVLAVACTPPGASANLCLTGDADGKARLFDLAGGSDQPIREMKGQHRGAINAVAFSADGKWCATGGDDTKIRLWNTATGDLIYVFPEGHRGSITSVCFTPNDQLVSAASDKTLRLWKVGADKAELLKTFEPRGGEVDVLGVSPDGKRALFDQGRTLSILTLPSGVTDSVFHSSAGTSNFSNFALFSPDGRMVLTAGASEGRLQLWRVPGGMDRVSELRQLSPPDRTSATCAAFAPDGSFLVTGTRDRQVHFWKLKAAKEDLDRQLGADITLIERDVSSSSRQVRVWAELPNPNHMLSPGTTVNIVIYPEE